MAIPLLLTGVTGGLGTKILNDMLNVHHVLPQHIIASSRSENNRSHYESQGVQFRVADYNDPETLLVAFDRVEYLLFVSSSEIDTPKRMVEHRNVINAAKAKQVKKVWYVSLAFGGFGDRSKIRFQEAHYQTEHLLKASGLEFVSLRAGLYSDAFPLFLNWYPSSTSILMPILSPPVSTGQVAFTSRDELGEAIATLLSKGLSAFPTIQPKTEMNIILLTSTRTNSMVDLVDAINRGRGTNMPVKYLPQDAWIEESFKTDEAGKPRSWFEARLVFMQGLCAGDAEWRDPALETLLGRVPEFGTQAVERMLRNNPEFRWHQNEMRRL